MAGGGEQLRAPTATEAVGGATVMDVSVTPVAVTVRLTAGEVMPLTVAEIAVVPAATPMARPRLFAALPIVAKPGFDESHVAAFVRFCVEPSLKVPIAVNCSEALTAIEAGGLGVTATEVSVSALTVKPSVSDASSFPL